MTTPDPTSRSERSLLPNHQLTPPRSVYDQIRDLREVVAWYGEQTRLAGLGRNEGDAGRRALDADGGQRARDALAVVASQTDASKVGALPHRITMADGHVLVRETSSPSWDLYPSWVIHYPDGGFLSCQDESEIAGRFGLEALLAAAITTTGFGVEAFSVPEAGSGRLPNENGDLNEQLFDDPT